MIFWLGTHMPNWLKATDVPLFVSAVRLRTWKKLPRAIGPWCLDSGGFSELSLRGEWAVPPARYALEVQRWREEVGNLRWAAIQDWMCEPQILEKTGLTVPQHQARTVSNYRDLLAMAPEVPWVPVLQGWTRGDYLRCLDLYGRAGFDLTKLPVVGLGSVCRRQDTTMAEELIRELHGMGLKIHGFGFKLKGLRRIAHKLESADSMAWCLDASKNDPLPGCTHKQCNNCIRYAMRWRDRVLRAINAPKQSLLF